MSESDIANEEAGVILSKLEIDLREQYGGQPSHLRH